MSTYSSQLQPALQNLLQRIVWFFHQRSSCMTTHISADVQRITLNASCTTISGGRTKQLNTFCRVAGFMSDFLSFIVVELIRFFHRALQMLSSLAFTSLVFQVWLGGDVVTVLDLQSTGCNFNPSRVVSEMTYTVLSGTLNSTIPSTPAENLR